MSSLRDAFDGYDLYYGDDDDDCSLLVRRSVPDDQAEEETDSACYKIGKIYKILDLKKNKKKKNNWLDLKKQKKYRFKLYGDALVWSAVFIDWLDWFELVS